MTTTAISAHGVTLTRNGNTIAEITRVGKIKKTLDVFPATNSGSANSYKEVIAGLKEMAPLEIEGNFIAGDTTGQIGLDTDLEARTLQTFILTFPTAITATCTFTAYVTEFSMGDFPQDGKGLGFTATLTPSGKPTVAITASGNLTALTGIEETGAAALTFTPAFAAATKTYNVAVNTASTWVKFTPTLAGATITINNGTSSQDVASGAQSGTIAVTDAAITTITLSVKETGKVATVYTVHVYTP